MEVPVLWPRRDRRQWVVLRWVGIWLVSSPQPHSSSGFLGLILPPPRPLPAMDFFTTCTKLSLSPLPQTASAKLNFTGALTQVSLDPRAQQSSGVKLLLSHKSLRIQTRCACESRWLTLAFSGWELPADGNNQSCPKNSSIAPSSPVEFGFLDLTLAPDSIRWLHESELATCFPLGSPRSAFAFSSPQLSLRRGPVRGGVPVPRKGVDAILGHDFFSGGRFAGGATVVGEDGALMLEPSSSFDSRFKAQQPRLDFFVT
jgi:hypothetical protein